MGDRAHIVIRQSTPTVLAVPLYIYMHWGGTDRLSIAARALAKAKGRWSDPSYATRIIVSNVDKECAGPDTETGMGISTCSMDNEYPDTIIDLSKQTVTYETEVEGAEGWNPVVSSFEKFIELYGTPKN